MSLTVRRIRDITAPCWDREVWSRPWRPGARVRDFLPEGLDGLDGRTAIANLNGCAVPLDAPVADGAELVFAAAPGGPGTLIYLAISVALTLVSMALAPKPAPPPAMRRGRTIYNFGGLQNSFEQGVPVPVVYGEHRVAGPMLSLFARKPDDTGDRLWALVALSEGRIEGLIDEAGVLISTDQDDLAAAAIPDTIEVNDNAVANVRNALISLRMGTGAQALIPDFSDAVTSHAEGTDLSIFNTEFEEAAPLSSTSIRLKNTGALTAGEELVLEFGEAKEETVTIAAVQANGWVDLTAATTFQHAADTSVRRWDVVAVDPAVDAEAWDINLLFPSGLYRIRNSNGNRASKICVVRYRYKIRTDPPSSWTAWTPINVEANKNGGYRYSVRVDLPSKAAWEFEFYRVSEDPLFGENFVVETTLDTVNTILHDGFVYPQTAMLALKAAANNKVHGGQIAVTTLIRGRRVRVYTAASPATYHTRWTRNPAWAALDLLTDSRFGGGAKVGVAVQIEPVLQRWIDWAAYCEEWVLDGSDRATAVVGAHTAGGTTLDVLDASELVAGDFLRLGRGTTNEEVVEVGSIATNQITLPAWREDGTDRLTALSEDRAAGTTTIDVDDASDYLVGDFLRIGTGTAAEEVIEVGTIVVNRITIAAAGTLANAHQTGEEVQAVEANGLVNNHADGETVETVEARHTCDLVLERESNLWEVVEQVAAVGRGAVIRSGNTYWPWWDRPQEPVQLFSDANIAEGTLQYEHSVIGDAPNTLEVQFLNRERNYEQDHATIVDADAAAELDPIEKETVALYGVTRPSAAYRAARYHLKRRRLSRDKYQWECGLDALLAQAGDLVLLQHTTILDGKGCRVSAATSSSITLDQAVTVEAGQTYLVRVWHKATDAIETRELAVAPGTYAAGTALAISGTWSTTPTAGAVAAHGVAEKDTVPVILQSLTTTQDLRRRVVAFRYVEEAYLDEQDENTVEQSTWGGGNYKVPPGRSAFPGAVGDLAAVERAITLPDGTPRIAVDVAWTPPLAGLAVRYQLYLRETGETWWQPVGETTGTQHQLFDLFTIVDSYEIAVVAVGPGGGQLDPEDASSDSLTIVGPNPGGGGNPPPGFEVTVTPSGFAGSFIGVAPSTGEGASAGLGNLDYWEGRIGSWIGGMPLFRTRDRTIYTPAIPPGCPHLLFVRARSKGGIWSEDAVVVDLSAAAIPAGNTQKLDHRAKDDTPTPFAGTLTNMARWVPYGATNALKLNAAATSGSYETTAKDAGALTIGKKRMVWVSWTAEPDDTTETADGATYAAESLSGRRRTGEGRIDEDPVTVVPWVAGSPDGSTWDDWVKADRPVQISRRYYKAKLEIERADADVQINITDLRTYVVEQT